MDVYRIGDPPAATSEADYRLAAERRLGRAQLGQRAAPAALAADVKAALPIAQEEEQREAEQRAAEHRRTLEEAPSGGGQGMMN